MIQINQEQYFKNKIVELDNRVTDLEAKIAELEKQHGNNNTGSGENALTD